MSDPVVITGTAGAQLARGTVYTGSSVRDIVIANGVCKVTYETKTPDSERGAHTLYRKDGGQYVRAMTTQYGDWTFFAVAITATCDRATVIEASEDAAEVAFQWDALDLSSYNSGGPVALGPADEAIYTSGGVLKKIASTKLIKTIRVERGREGYFVGYHSIPRVGPQLLPTNNKETAAGERELGTGGNNRVFFSSAGVSCLHPDHGNQAGWAAAGFTGSDNRACWSQIDDFTSSPWNQAAVIALQPAGFPGTQTTGPWWVADLDYENATTFPFCRYICMVARYNSGSWQFGSGQYGFTVVHYVNEAQDSTGLTYPFQCFIGAFPYRSPDLSLEPTTYLENEVASRAAALVWPFANRRDQAFLSSDTTSAASVRDDLVTEVKDLTASSLAQIPFRAHDNRQDFRSWCNANPNGAFRRFQIRDVGTVPGSPVYDATQAWHETEFECVVCYPRNYRYGDQALLDLDDVLWEDLDAIDNAIGSNGSATTACVTTIEKTTEEGAACVFAVLRLKTEFWRAVA